MTKKVLLVNETELSDAIDLLRGSLSDKQINFIKKRWLNQVLYWDQRSKYFRGRYFFFRTFTIGFSVVIPVFTSLAMLYPEVNIHSILATISAAIVAGFSAWEGVANYGQLWIEKRRAAELLKVEGWLFFELGGHYSKKTHESNFPKFVSSVENLIAKEIGEYATVFKSTKDKKEPKGSEDPKKTKHGDTQDSPPSTDN